MKKFIVFILLLLPWFIGGLVFKFDESFYSSLSLPSFTLPGFIISIIWVIIYILTTISVFKVINTTNILKNKDYLYILLTNYLANMCFPLFFFVLRSPFLGLIMASMVLITTVYLFIETKFINKKASYFIIPYIVYDIYALILSFFVFIMNF